MDVPLLEPNQRWRVDQGDCIEWLNSLPADSADLIIGSPPYCDARTYGIDAVYSCQEWVDWMLRVTEAAVRVSKGLVLWVAAGVQRDNCYWPACEGLAWEWWQRGNQLWCPAVWWKVDEDGGGTGIPGSGGNVAGKRWLRKDWEYVLCFKKAGNIPYDHPEVMGHEPIYSKVGGAMSNRAADGRRINAGIGEALADPWRTASRGGSGCGGRRKDGRKMSGIAHDADDNIVLAKGRPFPAVANPGNCIVVKARVGGGHLGSRLAHENEAPFPEALVEFFVLSYCPPGGLVIDPFVGSGTTGAVAICHGRRFRGCDLRPSQVKLSRKRIARETPDMFVPLASQETNRAGEKTLFDPLE